MNVSRQWCVLEDHEDLGVDDDIDVIGRGGRIDFVESDDLVEEADQESFPSSDSPSWSPSTVSGDFDNLP